MRSRRVQDAIEALDHAYNLFFAVRLIAERSDTDSHMPLEMRGIQAIATSAVEKLNAARSMLEEALAAPAEDQAGGGDA